MAMKKFINDPKNLTKELLDSFAIAHGDLVTVKSDKIVCRIQPKPANKVALVTLGGAGHEPALSGFVGEGMLFDQVPQRCCAVAFDHGIFDVIAACPWPKKE
jgi:dihydroxyacetone kinase-like protein